MGADGKPDMDAKIVGAARQQALEGRGKEKLATRVAEVLLQDETLLDFSAQTKLKAPISPEAILVTTRRILVAKAGMLGKLNVDDANWIDVSSINIDQSMMSAKLSVEMANGGGWLLEGLEKDSAKRIYSYARSAQDQARTRRRDFALEEARARAGGVSVVTNAGGPPSAPDSGNGGPANSLRGRLAELKALRDEGLITAEEYESKRAEIIKSA